MVLEFFCHFARDLTGQMLRKRSIITQLDPEFIPIQNGHLPKFISYWNKLRVATLQCIVLS